MFVKSLLLLIGLSLLSTSNCTTLFIRAPRQDRSEKLKFGQASCISPNGRRLAFGANGFDNFQGALYIYDLKKGNGKKPEHWHRIRVNGNDTLHAEEKKPRELRVVERGSGFGFSCAIPLSSDRVIVGAPSHSLRRGAVYVFALDQKKDTWYQKEQLVVHDQKSGDLLGWAIVISDDCRYIIVSAKGRRANNGEVVVFKCAEQCSKCEISARIAPPDYTDTPGPRGIRIRNNFGIGLATNEDGSVLAIGCIGYKEERGAVYIYERVEDEWIMRQRIESPNAQKYAYFGYKLSMDANGETLAIGADGEEQYSGAVYMFARTKDDTVNYAHTQQLTPSKLSADDNFGGAVAISGDGRSVIVGAPGADRKGVRDHGVMYMFEESDSKDGNWLLKEEIGLPNEHSTPGSFFGWSVGLNEDGTRFVGTAPSSDSGSGIGAIGDYRRRLNKTGRKDVTTRRRRTERKPGLSSGKGDESKDESIHTTTESKQLPNVPIDETKADAKQIGNLQYDSVQSNNGSVHRVQNDSNNSPGDSSDESADLNHGTDTMRVDKQTVVDPDTKSKQEL